VAKPFYQADSGMTRRRQGTGLGLALVSAYCNLHQAEFSIESAVGKGTVATVRFPRDRSVVVLDRARRGDGMVVGIPGSAA
jgi:signal transduction histidine kinase